MAVDGTLNLVAIDAAIGLACKVHAGQTDKGGAPYILHCLAVMRMAEKRARASHPFLTEVETDPDLFTAHCMFTGVLHDTIEDYQGTNFEKQMLARTIQTQFGDQVYMSVIAMSHLANEDYETYIERVAEDPVARVVKICDLMHNMDPRRMPGRAITEKDFQRWDKYRKALVRLERE